MKSIRGRTSRNTVRTQRGIVCVRGVRKLRFVIATANTIVKMFMRNVKSRYKRKTCDGENISRDISAKYLVTCL